MSPIPSHILGGPPIAPPPVETKIRRTATPPAGVPPLVVPVSDPAPEPTGTHGFFPASADHEAARSIARDLRNQFALIHAAITTGVSSLAELGPRLAALDPEGRAAAAEAFDLARAEAIAGDLATALANHTAQ